MKEGRRNPKQGISGICLDPPLLPDIPGIKAHPLNYLPMINIPLVITGPSTFFDNVDRDSIGYISYDWLNRQSRSGSNIA